MSCVPARALFHTAPRCVEIRELPTPRPAAGEVLVRTVCSGISGGTERLVYRGEVPAEMALDDTIDALGGTFSYPLPYGYACVGEVAESAQAVFAFHPHQDIFAARASDLIPLPGIDPASATLLPLVETALQLTLDAAPGDRDPAELEKEEVALVVDASGNPDAPAMALDMLAHEGTLLIASWFGTKPVVLPLGGAFPRRRLALRSTQVSTVPARLSGTWSRSRRRQETVELLGELPLAQLCTHVFDFGAAADAVRAVDQGKPGLMHAVLNYDRSAAGDL